MLGLAHPWASSPSGTKPSKVTADRDEAIDWLANALKNGAAMVERDGLGRWRCWAMTPDNWERVMLGAKAGLKTDTLDTVSQDAYYAHPSVSFADFVGA